MRRWMGDADMLGERVDALCANTDDCKEEKKNGNTKRKKKTY